MTDHLERCGALGHERDGLGVGADAVASSVDTGGSIGIREERRLEGLPDTTLQDTVTLSPDGEGPEPVVLGEYDPAVLERDVRREPHDALGPFLRHDRITSPLAVRARGALSRDHLET